MSQQSYLIDTNILIGLEDDHTVEAAYSTFLALAATHKVDVFVHEAAKGPCCANAARDSLRESSMIAGGHEQTGEDHVQDHQLA
ncbi:hypothetical protein [Paracoccus sp. PAR01]|uniref:hypothetical protein n=1 Tax=Paracoccus sp. PAR01 TaxID=2769282 RepID=UPI00177B48B8|nr:hypothetical protein [Paracoccus sp. PAR01]MBD9528671.1 hypothetical protein [Paracoccus sp. PAR01]